MTAPFFPARELETVTPEFFANSACWQYDDLLRHFAPGAPSLVEAAKVFEKMAVRLRHQSETRSDYNEVSRHLSRSAHDQIRSIYFAFHDAVPIPRRPKDAMSYVRALRELVADAKQSAISGEPLHVHGGAVEFDLAYWEEWISALYVRVLSKWYGERSTYRHIGKFYGEFKWASATPHNNRYPPDYPMTMTIDPFYEEAAYDHSQ